LQLGFHLHQDVQHGTVHHPNRTVVLEQRVLVQNVVDLGQDFGGKKKKKSVKHVSQTSAKNLQKACEKNKRNITFGDRGGESVLFVGHYGEKVGLFFLPKLVGVREHLKRKKKINKK
jgi:hypothetical protein